MKLKLQCDNLTQDTKLFVPAKKKKTSRQQAPSKQFQGKISYRPRWHEVIGRHAMSWLYFSARICTECQLFSVHKRPEVQMSNAGDSVCDKHIQIHT
jgi:hypothetical protein